MMHGLRWVAAAALGAAASGACAQAIFTCVDAKGRKLTSDRPIAECADREQRELSQSGSTLRTVRPPMTQAERLAEEERTRKAEEEKSRQQEALRRDRALLTRYPNQATHDRERAVAIKRVDDTVVVAARRTAELQAQQKKLDQEAEFYRSDRARFPPDLKRQFEEQEKAVASQRKFLEGKEEEKARINARFDEELGNLKRIWGVAVAATSASAPASAVRPTASTVRK